MNHAFAHAEFFVIVSAAEAEAFAAVPRAIASLRDPDAGLATLAVAYALLPQGFREAFPASGDNAFGAFLQIFEADLLVTAPMTVELFIDTGVGAPIVRVAGHPLDIEAAAQLVHRLARSALPFGFEFAADSGGLAPGHGGGYVLVTEAGIKVVSTHDLLAAALVAAATGPCGGPRPSGRAALELALSRPGSED